MQGEKHVGIMTITDGLERRKSTCVLLIVLRPMFWLRLQALLKLGDCRPIKGAGRENASLQGTTITRMV